MQILTEITSNGFALELAGAWQADACALNYPEEVWSSYPDKASLVAELAYLTTLITPVILNHDRACYNTPEPEHFDLYNNCFEQAIPNLVEHVPAESSEEVLKRFRNVARMFPADTSLDIPTLVDGWNNRRVILPLSFGKDSLLSLAILTNMGYEVFPVIVDERVLPRNAALRTKMQGKMADELGIVCDEATNEIQLLSDYQVLGRPETWMQQAPVHFVFMLSMLPFCHYYRAPWIVCNNEYGNSLPRLHREGYIQPSMVMQSSAVTSQIKQLIRKQSAGQVNLANLIGGLGDFSIHHLLHDQFPEFGRYRTSCHIEVCDHERWCHSCTRCARAYLFQHAIGLDPADLQFAENMLQPSKAKHYSLFRSDHQPDPFHQFRAAEEMLACQMALTRDIKAPLLEQFANSGQKVQVSNRAKKRIFKQQQKPDNIQLEQNAAVFLRPKLAALTT